MDIKPEEFIAQIEEKNAKTIYLSTLLTEAMLPFLDGKDCKVIALMMDAGMDSAIIDPLDKAIMATIKTAICFFDMIISVVVISRASAPVQ